MSWERVEEKDGLETAILKGTKPGGPAAKVAGSLRLINGVTLVSVDGTRCAGLGYKDQINLIREAGRQSPALLWCESMQANVTLTMEHTAQ